MSQKIKNQSAKRQRRIVSEKEKRQKIESQRRIAAARTPEEHAAWLAYHREWKARRLAAMTPQDRAAWTKKQTASKLRSIANYSPEKKAARRAYQAQWMANKRASNRTEDRTKKRAWVNRKMKESPEFVLAERLRRRLCKAVARYAMKEAKPRTMQLVGCSRAELRAYLESKFKPGMSWENYGYRGWHVDHIRPVASFDLMNESEMQRCFHFTNLQPLWMKENLKKGTKILHMIKAA
jgi:hypothetical protein